MASRALAHIHSSMPPRGAAESARLRVPPPPRSERYDLDMGEAPSRQELEAVHRAARGQLDLLDGDRRGAPRRQRPPGADGCGPSRPVRPPLIPHLTVPSVSVIGETPSPSDHRAGCLDSSHGLAPHQPHALPPICPPRTGIWRSTVTATSRLGCGFPTRIERCNVPPPEPSGPLRHSGSARLRPSPRRAAAVDRVGQERPTATAREGGSACDSTSNR